MMFKRLLVPVDGAELTARAIDASVALARQLDAVIVGFVAEPPAPAPASSGADRLPVATVEQLRTEEHARQLLRQFESAAQRAGVAFDGHFEHARDVGRAIVAAAERHDCDLIVMVTHDRGRLGRLLAGSRTRDVLSRGRLPVLVLH